MPTRTFIFSVIFRSNNSNPLFASLATLLAEIPTMCIDARAHVLEQRLLSRPAYRKTYKPSCSSRLHDNGSALNSAVSPSPFRTRWPQRPLIVTSLMFQPLHLALASPRTTEDMSPLRPPRSVFHRSTFVSLLGQAALHVACMVLVVKVAQVHSPEVCV